MGKPIKPIRIRSASRQDVEAVLPLVVDFATSFHTDERVFRESFFRVLQSHSALVLVAEEEESSDRVLPGILARHFLCQWSGCMAGGNHGDGLAQTAWYWRGDDGEFRSLGEERGVCSSGTRNSTGIIVLYSNRL